MATLTASQIRALAAAVLPGASSHTLDIAVAIALAESRGRTDVISPTRDYGLWQINAPSWPQFSTASLLTPAGNARAMAHISKGGTNWNPWVTFGSKYRDFMPGGSQAAAYGITAGGPAAATIGIGSSPGEVVDFATGAAGALTGVATAWVEPLVSRAAVAVLAMVLTSFGLFLFALGLYRLTQSSTTAKQIAGATGAAAGGIGTIAALA